MGAAFYDPVFLHKQKREEGHRARLSVTYGNLYIRNMGGAIEAASKQGEGNLASPSEFPPVVRKAVTCLMPPSAITVQAPPKRDSDHQTTSGIRESLERLPQCRKATTVNLRPDGR